MEQQGLVRYNLLFCWCSNKNAFFMTLIWKWDFPHTLCVLACAKTPCMVSRAPSLVWWKGISGLTSFLQPLANLCGISSLSDQTGFRENMKCCTFLKRTSEVHRGATAWAAQYAQHSWPHTWSYLKQFKTRKRTTEGLCFVKLQQIQH